MLALRFETRYTLHEFLKININFLMLMLQSSYSDHAKELGNAVPDSAPLLFLKPVSSYIHEGEKIKVDL